MSGVPPPLLPSSLQIPLQANAAPQSLELISPSLSILLAKLPASSVVDAQIVSANRGAGVATILLPNGQSLSINLRLPQNFPVGTTLALQLPATANNAPVLRLLAVSTITGNLSPMRADGVAPPSPAPSATAPTALAQHAPTTLGAAAQANAPAATASPGQPVVLQAMLVRSETTLFPDGTSLTVRLSAPAALAGANPPILPPSAQSPQTMSPSPVPSAPATSNLSPALPPQPNAQPLQGAPQPTTQSPSLLSATSSPPLQTLTGTVTPNSTPAQMLIQTPVGLMSLGAPPDLPVGAQIQIQIIGTTPSGGPAAAPTAWAALSAALTELNQTSPQTAAALATRMPTLNADLAVTLTALVGTAQKGQLWRWLGEKAGSELQKTGKVELAQQLRAELGDVSTSKNAVGPQQEWQSWMIPLMVGGKIERIRLLMRRPPEDDDEKNRRNEEGIRFLLDLDLSRLGAMQLDGLVKRGEKRFDLILRTHSALSQEMRQDISRLFSSTLESLGMSGVASFQKSRTFVDPGLFSHQSDLTI